MKIRYTNLDNIKKNKQSILHVYKWMTKKKKMSRSYFIPHHAQIHNELLKENDHKTTITWIGHSTFLIQIDNVNILTDPVYAKMMGIKKRLTEPGIPFADLPRIDVVLISHAHYDHLDFPTIKKIGRGARYLLPVGLKSLFMRKKFQQSTELSWWESTRINGVEFTFVPAQHWTRRTFFDTNTSHWGGWVIKGRESEGSVYFAGDSAYFQGFKQIGERFNIDQAILPIGAYDPVQVMSNAHMSPEEAVKSFVDLQANTFIPMHYGTFKLANDTPEEALGLLQAEWKRLQLERERLKILLLGETLFV
ncbi:MBL fold metallo-hydrolase [Paenibacillus agricola]|uniref:MBL fold metallo-hydrolase n=1 Tax=Paenibacillus agricola TaxID=2716264 RepID=A0ABX0JAB2_9BACL|nr:MBL fold metallo-hydrolase [Paenibacillus agricola]NHN32335.1 MBL fold metallo-hydrolase [Paenibacillus agricola]